MICVRTAATTYAKTFAGVDTRSQFGVSCHNYSYTLYNMPAAACSTKTECTTFVPESLDKVLIMKY